MATKLVRVVIYCRNILCIKFHDLLITWSRDKYKTYIYTSAVLMKTKLGRVITCSGGTTTVKSRELLIM